MFRSWKIGLVAFILLVPIISIASMPAKADEPGTGWEVFETISSEIQVSPGEYIYFSYNTQSHELEFHKIPDITSKAQDALDLVPSWMRANLSYKFRQLSDADQNTYADLIINSPDARYRDEIGFVIAHTSTDVLTHKYFFPGLITYNAELIYQNDQYLDYVQVVDEADHTTLHYHDRDNITTVLEKENYYWFVVHLKLSDELPTYVDPNYNYYNTAPNDRNYGVSPPTGKFWRDYLFYENKSGQPLLKEKLEGKYTYYDAIGAINSWVGASMRFTSDNERPVQPVRIYQKGIGRCGEHQDLRGAAARAALIPTVWTLNPAEDHVWNEYFDGRWIHWDGGRENPLMYEKNWGKKISTVWNWRGDGLTWSVTERYSEGYSNLTSTVKDASGRPVEGADVMIATENFYDSNYLTMTQWATTGPDGDLLTTIGDQRNYWAQADGGDLGKQPTGDSVTSIISNSVDGNTYNKNFQLPLSAPTLKFQEKAPASDPDNRYQINVDLEVVSSLVHGENLYTGERYDKYYDHGYVDFFWTDLMNFDLYEDSRSFLGYDLNERIDELDIDIILPKENIYYGVISNEFSDHAMKTVNITVTVESYLDLTIDEPASGSKFTLGSQFIVSGTSFSPWGVRSVECNLYANTSSFVVNDVTEGDDPPFTNWEMVIDTMDLGPGLHTIQIIAADGTRNISREISIDIEDKGAPILEILEPDDRGRFRKNETLDLSGVCSDDHLVESLTYHIDNDLPGKIDITDNIENGSWDLQLDLVEIEVGVHEIHFKAIDPSSNTVSESLEFEVLEIDAPILSIETPSSGSIVKEGFVTIEGHLSDISGIRSFKVSINGGDWENIRSSRIDDDLFLYEFNAYGIKNETLNFHFYAEDQVGNIAEDSVEITIDGIEPVIDIPLEQRTIIVKDGDGFQLNGFINDTSGITSLDLVRRSGSGEDLDLIGYLNGNVLDCRIDTKDFLIINGQDLEILAIDTVGLTHSVPIDITVDLSQPSAELFLSDPVQIGESYEIELQISDDTWFGSIILTLHDGTEMNITEDISSFGWNMIIVDSIGGQPGLHTLELSAVDIVGNKATASTEVFLFDTSSDNDGDGLPDIWEIENGLDHLLDDSGEDPDDDGFTNLEEYLGSDKMPGGDDGSNPSKKSSVPVYPQTDSADLALVILIVVGLLIIIVMVGAMIVVLFFRSKRTQLFPDPPPMIQGRNPSNPPPQNMQPAPPQQQLQQPSQQIVSPLSLPPPPTQ